MNGGNFPATKMSGWLENNLRKAGHRLPTPIFCMNSKWRAKVCSKNNFKNTIWCLHISFFSFFYLFSGCAALDVYIILTVFLLICRFTSLYWSKEQSMPLCHQLRQTFACQFAEQFASRIFYPHFGNAFIYISARRKKVYEYIKMLNVVVTNIQLKKKLDDSFHFSLAPSLPPSPTPHP